MRIALLVTLILLTIFTRFWQLDNPDPSADELSYIDDGYLLVINDPRIVPRHHMFHHPPPNFPHPFLVNSLIGASFQTFGFSIFAGRLPIAFFGSLTVFLVFLGLLKLSKSFNLSLLTALFASILPLNVRYARESYLDAALSFFVILTAFFWVNFLQSRKIIYGSLVGISAALAISTKVTGLALIPTLLFSAIFFRKKINWSARFFMAIVVPFCIVFFLLNSPSAYLNGLLYHPNTKTESWGIISILAGFFSPKYFSYWAYMALFNFTLPLIIFTFYTVWHFFKKPFTIPYPLFALTIFTISYSLLSVITHLPSSISGPWAYQPEINLILINVIWTAFLLVKSFRKLWLILSFFLILPFTFIHGFRLTSDPYLSYHNVKFGEQNIKEITSDINNFAMQKQEFYLHAQLSSSAIPEWLYAKNVNNKPWTHSQPLDAIITDGPTEKKDGYNLYKRYSYEKQLPLNLYLRNN